MHSVVVAISIDNNLRMHKKMNLFLNLLTRADLQSDISAPLCIHLKSSRGHHNLSLGSFQIHSESEEPGICLL